MVTLLPWNGRVEGLEKGPAMPLWDHTLAEHTERAVGAARLGRSGLVVRQGTVLGPEVLRAALQLGVDLGEDCAFRLGGRLGELVEQASLGRDPVALWYVPGAREAADLTPERLALARQVELDPAERLLDLDLGGERMPLSDRLVLRVDHHVQLLWGNLLGLGSFLWRRLLHRSTALAGLKAAWGALRGGGLSRGAVARGLSRSAGVHAHATVEGCVLSPTARVEPGAVVRGCVLGPGARVEAHAICEGSVLGPDAVVQRQAMIRFSVLGAGAMHGGAAQLAVFGRGASMKLGSYLMDQSFDDQAVRVPVGERFVRAPLGLAGVCLGEGSRIGSGVWIAPGRVLPPRSVVVAQDVLRSFGQPAPYRVWSEE